MKYSKYSSLIVLLFLSNQLFAQKNKKLSKEKLAIINSVETHQQELIGLSDKVWELAETALMEYESSKILADYAELQGFTVERGIAGMPTAFLASYGSGSPIIAVLGEFDALPGISQKAAPVKEPLNDGAAGHGCGHNMFGAGSLGAALAIKELIEAGKLNGTVRFYGTPAEEAIGGKIYMARDGVFDDVDISLDWHPSQTTKANVQSSLAMVDFNVEFFGKSAHASADPWNGRSAVDGMELFNMGVNVFREHVQPTVRMHYAIKAGGDVPNVVPEYAKVWMWIRDSKRSVVAEVYERVQEIARGAAIMAGVDYKISLNGGDYEILVNRTGGKAMHDNLEMLGPITYTSEEIEFARKIQQATGKPQNGLSSEIVPFEETREHPGGGSTDVGDVSWVVPEIRLSVATAPIGTPWHSWAVVACGGMSIGHKGMLYAAKAIGTTMVDLFQDASLRTKIKAEFEEKKGDQIFKAMLPEGPPPIPKKE